MEESDHETSHTFVAAFSLPLTTSTAFGQAFTLTAGSGAVGEDIDVSLDSDSIVQAWSLGLCTGDPVDFQVDSVGDGATTAGATGGGPPDFDTHNQFPEG